MSDRRPWSRLVPPMLAGFTLAILAAAVNIILNAAGPRGIDLSSQAAIHPFRGSTS